MMYYAVVTIVRYVLFVTVFCCSPQAACCPRRIVSLPAQTYEIRERCLVLSVAKPRCDLEGMLKNCDPFVHEDLQYVSKFYG